MYIIVEPQLSGPSVNQLFVLYKLVSCPTTFRDNIKVNGNHSFNYPNASVNTT